MDHKDLYMEWCAQIQYSCGHARRAAWEGDAHDVIERYKSTSTWQNCHEVGDKIYPIHNDLVGGLLYTNPQIEVNPLDVSGQIPALLAKKRADYLWNTYDYWAQFAAALSDSLFSGLGWVKIGYLGSSTGESDITRPYVVDPTSSEYLVEQEKIRKMHKGSWEGHPVVSAIPFYDVHFDPDSDRRLNNTWIAHRITLPLFVAEHRKGWTAKGRKFLKDSRPLGTTRTVYGWDANNVRVAAEVQPQGPMDMVEVWEFYDLVRGLWGCFSLSGGTEGEWLVPPTVSPYPDGSPFYAIPAWEVVGSPFPVGELPKVLGIIKEGDAFASRAMADIAGQRTVFMIPQTLFDHPDYRTMLEEGTDNLFLPYDPLQGEAGIQILKSTGMDPNMIIMSDRLAAQAIQTAGVDAYRSGGGNLPDRQTATSAALVADAVNARTSARLRGMERSISDVIFAVIAMERLYGKDEWVVDVSDLVSPEFVRVTEGLDQGYESLYVGLKDKVFYKGTRESLEGRYLFEVSAGSTQAVTPAVRRQQSISLLQTLAPFAGAVDPITQQPLVNLAQLLEYVVREGFDIPIADRIVNPLAGNAATEGPVGIGSQPGVSVAQPGGTAGPGSGNEAAPGAFQDDPASVGLAL